MKKLLILFLLVGCANTPSDLAVRQADERRQCDGVLVRERWGDRDTLRVGGREKLGLAKQWCAQ